MRLNDLSPAEGSRKSKTRVGRGIGSGLGKTCGRGHKGQKARAGGFHKVGFEGGQMPLQRRLPKFGFHSAMASESAELPLYKLAAIKEASVDLDALKALGLVGQHVKRVKIIAKGEVSSAYAIKGLSASKGARSAIESAGGSISD